LGRLRETMKNYSVIVIGAGHAGIEAAHAAAKLGCSTLLLTIDIDGVGKLSCNPAVGGIAKGHLVREVDALGGLMGKITDECALGYRILNRSKGKAVWATRAQVDMYDYPRQARKFIEQTDCLSIQQAQVQELLVKNKKIYGVRTNFGEIISARAVIVCAGTFLKSIIHIGMEHFKGGRLNEPSSDELFASIKKIGLGLKHFKTGTCARLDKRTIDFSVMQEQVPEDDVAPFSLTNAVISQRKVSCFITHTTPKTHEIIRKNLKYSPLYTGKIKSTGVRYCPSLEDKVVKFSDRQRHQIFIEPEGFNSIEVYPNGISTSLPFAVQLAFIRSIKGFQRAEIIKPGYGIEHGVIDPRQLYPTFEAKAIKGLYFAGQVNGTTGYEEAAAQGLIAGINAALFVKKRKPFLLRREDAYIGVLIDDLTAKGVDEPYRMFTSRSEFRLRLRESNADIRLAAMGYGLGLLAKADFQIVCDKKRRIEKELRHLQSTKIVFEKQRRSLAQILRRPACSLETFQKQVSLAPDNYQARREVEIIIKYESLLKREAVWAKDLQNLSRIKIPALDYAKVPSLSREIVDKLKRFKPGSLQEALSISGVTPAAIVAIFHYLRSHKSSPKPLHFSQ